VVEPPEPVEPFEPPLLVGALDVAPLPNGCALETGPGEVDADTPGAPGLGDADEPHAVTVITRTNPATTVERRWSVAVASI
jgi:hypothetical protein